MSSSASSKKQWDASRNGADRRTITGGSSGRRTSAQENGGKKMQSYCLRYALRVIDKHAKTNNNNGTIRSSNHKKEIAARVGKRLREEMMPPSYCKAEDPVVDNMGQSNKQRETEVQTHKRAVDKLEKQLAAAAEALKGARKQKELGQKELNRIRKEQETGNDALPAVFGHDSDEKDVVLPPATSTTHNMDYKRAPAGTMSDLLKQLS